jgi:amino acid transporter
MQFAKQVLTCAATDAIDTDPKSSDLRFIAIVALSVLCLFHYFSSRVGRDLNQVLALIKIIFLVAVASAGCWQIKHHNRPEYKQNPNRNASSSATAFLYIVFSFSGWQNATYVSTLGSISGSFT